MVKSFATALVCGCVFVAYASAQEVFVGEQKAKPKYPKAEAAMDVNKSTVQVDKAKKTDATSKSAAVASKPESVAEKKSAIAATSKMAKAETRTPTAVAKAAPAVAPGQRAPAATPSPIVRPQTPLLAKSKATSKLPAAAVPPPSKIAPGQTSPSVSAGSQVSVAPAPNKPSKPIEKRSQTGLVLAKEPAPPAEGPGPDLTTKAKKPAVPAAKVAVKNPPKATTIAPKPSIEADEEESIAAAPSGSTPVIASATVLKKTAAFPISTFAKPATDAHSIASAPATLQNRREVPAVTKVALTQSSSLESTPPLSSEHYETAFIKLADGFDFPVGRPDAQGYYKARGFRSHGHMGEDWDGVGGGDTDLGDPIYAIGDGLVVFARDCHMGWGNVVIIRHSYREGGTVKTIDSLYGHLLNMLVRKGQAVTRGQRIATMGTAHGLYDAHLHLEIRKNIEIGMSRAAFAQDFSNYYDPSTFIVAHRHLQAGGGNYRVAMNTFTHDSRIRWDKVRNYSHAHTGGGQSESAAALKRALASKNNG